MKPPWSTVALWVAIVVTAGPYLFSVEADPDLWGHTFFGLRHLESGVLEHVDVYSYTTDGHPWINHEWLAELAFAVAYRAGGQAGLAALRGFLLLSLVAVLARSWQERTERYPLAVVGLCFWSLPYLDTFMNVRPHAFTWLFLGLELLWAEWIRKGRVAWALAFVPLAAVWANTHGGFVVGVGAAVLLLGSLVAGLEGPLRPWTGRERAILLIAIVLVPLATLVNPYGFGLHVYLVKALALDRPISEWQPIDASMRLHFAITLAAVVGGLIATRKRDRAAQWVLFLVGCYAGWAHARFFIFFVVASTVVLFDTITALLDRILPRQRLGLQTIGVALLGLVSVAPAVRACGRGFEVTVPPRAFPLFAVQAIALRPELAGSRVAVPFQWGEYAIWHLWPRFRVSSDGRYETAYLPGSVERALAAQGDGDVAAFLHDRPADLALVVAGSPLDQAFGRRSYWTAWYRDAGAVIYLPKGAAAPPLPTRDELLDIGDALRFP